MQATELNLELVCPPEADPAEFSWNFLSPNSSNNSSMDALDLYFESPSSSPILEGRGSHPRKQSDSAISHPPLYEDLVSYPVTSEFTSRNSSVDYASSVHSEDFWNQSTRCPTLQSCLRVRPLPIPSLWIASTVAANRTAKLRVISDKRERKKFAVSRRSLRNFGRKSPAITRGARLLV